MILRYGLLAYSGRTGFIYKLMKPEHLDESRIQATTTQLPITQKKMKQNHQAPTHGGNLNKAIEHFGRPKQEWLDLSTGINPHPYPAPKIEQEAWHRLPEPDQTLTEAAKKYCNAKQILAVAGTQAAIQALPLCRIKQSGTAKVIIAAPSYAEYAHRWQQEGHQVIPCHPDQLQTEVENNADILIICNPNNPTGTVIPSEQLLNWRKKLAKRNGWLIVDEAFGDMTPQNSIAQHADQPGLIVLKSIGKFFGLAGLRLGFVAAEKTILDMLEQQLGPWSISGPAQKIGVAALTDAAWHQHMKITLAAEGARLQTLLKKHGIQSNGTDLFQWWQLPPQMAERCWRHMAEQGIWVRLFTDQAAGIRLGLPPDESGWQRLEHALTTWRETAPA